MKCLRVYTAIAVPNSLSLQTGVEAFICALRIFSGAHSRTFKITEVLLAGNYCVDMLLFLSFLMSVMTALASFTARYVKFLGVRKIIEQGIIV